MTSDIHKSRIVHLNQKPCNPDGNYILYWVQAAPRVVCNHALEYACARAVQLSKPVVACFGLTQRSEFNRFANARHYQFLIQGLVDLSRALAERKIPLLIGISPPAKIACLLAGECVQVVVDKGYLRIQREWYKEVMEESCVRVTQVETNVVVPVILASLKEEYAARTIRPRIWKHVPELMKTPDIVYPPEDIQDPAEFGIDFVKDLDGDIEWINLNGVEINDVDSILDKLDVDKTVPAIKDIIGGETAARERLDEFCDTKLLKYDEGRNVPGSDYLSGMSMYLHFGHISPITIVQRLNLTKGGKSAKDAFIEELVVRRELAMNFVWYNKHYDSIKCLPAWAIKTIEDHAADKRPYIYSSDELEKGVTHDKYWNACQLEMVHKGKMHGYMRMYWGKKVIEWSRDCETAFNTLVYLNDKYEIDGRDPNGYCGVAWCFGKHDQGWAERAIFGKLRYMNDAGLKRKFKDKLEIYVHKNYKIAGRKVGDEKRLLDLERVVPKKKAKIESQE